MNVHLLLFPHSLSPPPFSIPAPRLTHSGIYFSVSIPWCPLYLFNTEQREDAGPKPTLCTQCSVLTFWKSTSDHCCVSALAQLLKNWSRIALDSPYSSTPPVLLLVFFPISPLLSEKQLLSPDQLICSEKTFLHLECTNCFKHETAKRNTNSWIKF